MFLFTAEPGLQSTLVGLAGVVLVAIIVLALNIQKHVLELITAFGGSAAILTGILLFFQRISLDALGENPVRMVL